MKITHTPAQVSEIAKTLRLFVLSGHIGEIRVIGSGAPFGVYFGHEDIETAAEQAANYQKAAKGVYLVMNQIDPALCDRPQLVETCALTKDLDIVRRNWLLIDFDPTSPERGAEDSATDAEKEAARQKMVEVDSWLDDQNWPAPIVADSGNGWHLLFRVDLPNDDPSHRLTGLRASELASLSPASFDLAADTPTVTLEVGYSKRRRTDILPLHSDLVARIRQWLTEREWAQDNQRAILPLNRAAGTKRERLFPGTWTEKAAPMFRKDLEAARQVWQKEAENNAAETEECRTAFANFG